MEQKYTHFLGKLSKYILMSLMLALLISVVLGTVNLFMVVYESIVTGEPKYLINVKELYPIFNLVLIIVVGVELLRSLQYIMGHSQVPVKSVLNIAIVAIANKVITLDIKTEGMQIAIGIGVLILAMAVAVYLTSCKSSKSAEPDELTDH